MNARILKNGMLKGLVMTLCLGMVLMPVPFAAIANAEAGLDPEAVREAALAMGLDSLRNVEIPEVDLSDYLNPGKASHRLLAVLGKALAWDMQVGSDGQACATCHYQAGIDPRSKNQLNPGFKAGDFIDFGDIGALVNADAGFPQFEPNYQLVEGDFPTHLLQFPEQESYNGRHVLKDTDDVVSSQGAFNKEFVAVLPGLLNDIGKPNPGHPNTVFEGNRNVEPRNAPTWINALFYHSNFWDGRAHNLFNGSSVIGPLDTGAGIYVAVGDKLEFTQIAIENSSLASQAVGPPTSILEMSFVGRTFPDIGHKLLRARPLQYQEVSKTDSILGKYASKGKKGLNFQTYETLVKAVFQPKYWNSKKLVKIGEGRYTQMEANFALFFGLAVQAYEFELISGRSPFDRFMEGDNTALSQDELKGLLVFLNRGPDRNEPALNTAISQAAGAGIVVSQGNCVSCHGGAVFSDATFPALADGDELELIEVEDTTKLVDGLLAVNEDVQGLLDNGFSDIGVRSTSEDLGRGGIEGGFPLSFTRQMLNPDLQFLLEGVIEEDEFPCAPGPVGDCPAQLMVDGAFKIPSLRNVELTAPYFHNGGQATLEQVVEFYDRHGDFADVNIGQIDRNLALIELGEGDEELLVEFLLTLTDGRVRDESGVFDHPQLIVPIDGKAKFLGIFGKLLYNPDDVKVIPAVGAAGRAASGLPEIELFLGIDQSED